MCDECEVTVKSINEGVNVIVDGYIVLTFRNDTRRVHLVADAVTRIWTDKTGYISVIK
jgi:hypothetical protein